jgi:integrase
MVVQYTYQENDVYYFQRRVPVDVSEYYSTSKIVICLKTKSSRKAAVATQSICSKLEDYWFSLRFKAIDIPASHLLVESRGNSLSNQPKIDESLQLYIRLKGKGKTKSFHRTAERNIEYLIKCLGARSIDQYSTVDAGTFRDWLFDKELSSSSVKRVFSSIISIMNLSIQENGIDIRNAFSGIYIPDDESVLKRNPISASNIIKIQSECRRVDDELRWIVALISDTGLRLSEAVGLHVKDFDLQNDVPHVLIQPHAWRRLKTPSSKRRVPLVGMSLWAAKRIVGNASTEFCFPRYTNSQKCNANSASAALNKWLKPIGNKSDVIHGFRHSFRDRLRAAEVQVDLIDQLGGWSLKSVGQGYGEGYPLGVCIKAMKKII